MANKNPKTDHLIPFKPGNKFAKGHGRPKVEKLKKEQLQEIKNISEDLQLSLARYTHDLLNGKVTGIADVRNNKQENAFKGLISAVLMRSFNKGDAKSLDTVLNRVIGPVKHKVDITTNEESLNQTNNEVVDKLKTEFKSLLQAKEEWQSQTSSEPGLLSSAQSSPSESTQE